MLIFNQREDDKIQFFYPPDFFRLFLDRISQLSPDEPTYRVGQAVYDATLGLYHSWYIRMGAGVAMYTLPTKCVLFERVSE